MKAFKLFLLSLIPALALAQPYGGEMCRVYDGTDTATVASSLDSRNGLDVQQSSIASKNIINFSSLNVSDRLLANATKVFSPGGTRSTYYDLQGYGNILVNFSDNTGGALGGTLYVRWSGDGVNTSNNDPGDGTGGANYSTVYATATDGLVVEGRILPLGGRYVNFVYVNNGIDQGNTGTNFCDFTVDAVPIGFSSQVTVTNTNLPVVGAELTPAELAGQPVIIGGVDSIGAPTTKNALVVNSSGEPGISELATPATAADATTNPSVSKIGSYGYSYNGTTWDRIRSALNALNSTGTGIPNAAQVAQFDDTSPTAITENQFGHVRMSTNRNQYMTLRDAAGNERGQNVNANNAALVTGELAHDAVDSGNPVKMGAKAIAHGTTPTAVAAADRTDLYANREGLPWIIGGAPNVTTIRANYTAAQTDTAIVTVSSGTKIIVTRCSVTADNANTVDVQARIGFGATNTPTATGVVLSHPGIAAGSGVIEGSGSGMLGVGGDGEDLRITSEVPTTGSIDVVCSYYTTAS